MRSVRVTCIMGDMTTTTVATKTCMACGHGERVRMTDDEIVRPYLCHECHRAQLVEDRFWERYYRDHPGERRAIAEPDIEHPVVWAPRHRVDPAEVWDGLMGEQAHYEYE